MIPRYGHPPLSGKRYTLRPGAYAILPRGNALLLTIENAEDRELQLPGGGIDPGESPLRALYREVREETGWSIARPCHLSSYRRFVFMPEYDLWAEKMCHVFVARPVRLLHPPTETHHVATWMPMDTAAHMLATPGDCKVVSDYVSRMSLP